ACPDAKHEAEQDDTESVRRCRYGRGRRRAQQGQTLASRLALEILRERRFLDLVLQIAVAGLRDSVIACELDVLALDTRRLGQILLIACQVRARSVGVGAQRGELTACSVELALSAQIVRIIRLLGAGLGARCTLRGHIRNGAPQALNIGVLRSVFLL